MSEFITEQQLDDKLASSGMQKSLSSSPLLDLMIIVKVYLKTENNPELRDHSCFGKKMGQKLNAV
jgi:hypothetical protein